LQRIGASASGADEKLQRPRSNQALENHPVMLW